MFTNVHVFGFRSVVSEVGGDKCRKEEQIRGQAARGPSLAL